MGQGQVSDRPKKKSSHSISAFQSLYRSVVLDMSEMQVVSKSLLDEPFIYGSNASPLTASCMLQDLLQYARRHNPIIQAYKTMAEIKQGSTGLPLLPTDAAAGIFGQQQHQGPLHDMYKQTQENAVYLAVNNRPVEARAFPADAIIGGDQSLFMLHCVHTLKSCLLLLLLPVLSVLHREGAALTLNLFMLPREGGNTRLAI